jgi:Tol biopolymer transport system component
MFPPQMRIVKTRIDEADGTAGSLEVVEGDGTSYVAECSISPDGEYLLYCSLASGQGDIFLKNLSSGKIIPLVTAPGYDGGPFFSPDGERICYRSDRHGNNLLQLFVADLERGEDGEFIGIGREYQLTDNAHVNWCPFWHPNGEHIVYATSEMGHRNYEVYIVDAMEDDDVMPTHVRYGTAKRRVTEADGADVLPVFDPTGTMMMWTGQRDPKGTSQLWIAPFSFAEHRPSAVPAGAYGRGR